jgi:hypothetical protein
MVGLKLVILSLANTATGHSHPIHFGGRGLVKHHFLDIQTLDQRDPPPT